MLSPLPRSRRIASLLLASCALTLGAAGPWAHAADQLVTGTVAPSIGIGLSADGAAVGGERTTVTRERRGDTIIVTVVPGG